MQPLRVHSPELDLFLLKKSSTYMKKYNKWVSGRKLSCTWQPCSRLGVYRRFGRHYFPSAASLLPQVSAFRPSQFLLITQSFSPTTSTLLPSKEYTFWSIMSSHSQVGTHDGKWERHPSSFLNTSEVPIRQPSPPSLRRLMVSSGGDLRQVRLRGKGLDCGTRGQSMANSVKIYVWG